ncbi:MAG TPA: hydantoinase/oxoprolinase family protein, partial [Terriglobales bacterium]|nr:hydantoinase/oxoprolinase family protein [Terriglobales bacterium]
ATNEAEVAGLPVRVPMLDIHTVGAGGGSLARFDAAGALRVGPESAGADPGPICYGKGEQPTVTDANLLLGRLRPDQFLGGGFTLDVERTRRMVRQWLKAAGSTLGVEEFAAGVIRVVNATMEKAIRVVSIERGYDPREFALVAFGGAGGLHACELASGLGIPRVIVPALPGALSAYGILVSDVVKDYSRTVLWRASGDGERELLPRMERELGQMKRAAEKAFREENWRGKIHWEATADLRYRGQGYELNVAAGRGLLAAFHAEHQRRYGYSHPQREVEIVTVRLRARIPAEPPKSGGDKRGVRRDRRPRLSGGASAPQSAAVVFSAKPARAAIVARESLPIAKRQRGPAIVTEYSATTVVPPGVEYELDRAGNLILYLRR